MSSILRHRTRRAVVLGSVLAVIGGSVAVAAPAAAADSPPGTVLYNAAATLPPELPTLADGKRISYVSTTVNGASVTVTGLVLTPKQQRAHKTVVWGHGTTGLANQCAPSDHQAVFWPEARTAIAELLRRGWTVAAPDYQGLGTPDQHPYLVGGSQARTLIDSA